MAGKPGRSGGKREGAGRKPGPPKSAGVSADAAPANDPLMFLLSVMNDPLADAVLRVRAAVTACQYTHAKKGEGGKKEAREEAAKAAAGGRFSTAAPPRLIVNNE